MFPWPIVFLRFLGYVGVYINATVVPLLIYKITGSTTYAGLALMVEWLPKLFFYLQGGVWAAKLGSGRAHVIAEGMRVVAFGVLLMAWGAGVWWAVALAAAMVQAANAICNIVFESLGAPYGIHGHVRLMQADLAAGVAIVPLAYFLPLESLIVLGVILHLVCVLAVGRLQRYYGTVLAVRGNVVEGVKKFLSYRPLVVLVLAGLVFSVPGAMAASTLPFILKEANPLWVGAFAISVFNLVRVLASFVLLETVKKRSRDNRLAWESVVGVGLGTALVVWGGGVWIAVGLMIAFASGSLWGAWSRQLRQEYLPEADRLPLTGIIISVEAMAYLIGAAILACVAAPVRGLYVGVQLCAMVVVAAAILWLLAAGANKKVEEKESF